MASIDTFLLGRDNVRYHILDLGMTNLGQFDKTTGRFIIRWVPVPISALTVRTYVISMCLAALRVVVVCRGEISQKRSDLCSVPP